MFLSSGVFGQTVSQCLQSGVLGPGTQTSSHCMPQHVVVIFLSSRTSRQTLRQRLALQPQGAQHRSAALPTLTSIGANAAEIMDPRNSRRDEDFMDVTPMTARTEFEISNLKSLIPTGTREKKRDNRKVITS
jgi:hypothetical protein